MAAAPSEPHIRPLKDSDSFEDLTALLHRAYRVLADMGLRYLATHQDVATTRERASRGHCFVLDDAGTLVGTVTYFPSPPEADMPLAGRADVAYFGQMAVEPSRQGRGFGARLVAHVEALARRDGKAEIALDTAEPAHHLIDWYTRLGYRVVGRVQWDVTNYRSVIMSKALATRE